MSVQNKIYLVIALWIVACAAMFFYGFKVLETGNRAALQQISKQKNQQLVLKAEQDSYRLAQKDLEDMEKKPLKPEDFFSADISLVKQIEALENLGKARGVNLSLNGISGTINTVSKAKAQSELFIVPYGLSVSGSFSQVVDFIETLENLDFITTLGTLNVSSSGDGNVSASMSASMYIRRR